MPCFEFMPYIVNKMTVKGSESEIGYTDGKIIKLWKIAKRPSHLLNRLNFINLW